MTTKEVRVTPDFASVLLGKMGNNRRLNDERVNLYADQMRKGLWKRSPQGIVIDEDGKLIDGQHRLRAVIKSGCDVMMCITYGAPAETIKVLDCGQARTLSQTMKICEASIMYRDRYVVSCINAVRGIRHHVAAISMDEYIGICDKHRKTLEIMWRLGCFVHTNAYAMFNAFIFTAIENGEPEADLAKFIKSFKYTDSVPGTNIKWAVSLRDKIVSGELKRPSIENIRT